MKRLFLSAVALCALIAPASFAPVAARGGPAGSVNPSVMPEITAPTAYMVDVNSGRVLFARDAHRRFVPASLTKIMTSYVAFELISQGKLKLDQTFVMDSPTFRQWHGVGSTMFLGENSHTTVAELLDVPRHAGRRGAACGHFPHRQVIHPLQRLLLHHLGRGHAKLGGLRTYIGQLVKPSLLLLPARGKRVCERAVGAT